MPEKISIMNPREKQVYTWFLVVVLVLFCLATYISRFNPLEVLWEQGEFWKFLFQDFLPPRFNASPVVVESILVTFALAVSSSFVAAVFAFLFAVFGSTSLSPWKGLARTIRGFANATINEALKPFYSFFAASLAALRRSSLYGAVSRKEKRPFSISNSLQPVSGSTSVSLQTAGCLRLYAVSLFLRSVLWVRMKMVGSFSSK